LWCWIAARDARPRVRHAVVRDFGPLAHGHWLVHLLVDSSGRHVPPAANFRNGNRSTIHLGVRGFRRSTDRRAQLNRQAAPVAGCGSGAFSRTSESGGLSSHAGHTSARIQPQRTLELKLSEPLLESVCVVAGEIGGLLDDPIAGDSAAE